MTDNNILINIPNFERENGRTPDSIKYNKQCPDFVVLNDGSLVGEYRYCDLSTQCRQMDILPNGKAVSMESDFLPIYNPAGELVSHELYCTGMHDLRALKEKIDDEKVS